MLNYFTDTADDVIAVFVEDFKGTLLVYSLHDSQDIDEKIELCKLYRQFYKIVWINPNKYTGKENIE